MTECAKCGASMPYSVDRGIGVKGGRSLPSAVRKCPACGWDPEAPVEGGPSKPKKTGVKPPKAGKSFSGGG